MYILKLQVCLLTSKEKKPSTKTDVKKDGLDQCLLEVRFIFKNLM